MLDVPLGDVRLCLNMTLGFLPSSTMHNAHLFVESFGGINNVCNECMDPVVIDFTVIIIHDDSQMGEACNLTLQVLDKHWIQTFFAWHRTIAIFIYKLLVTCKTQQMAPFNPHA